MRGTFHGGPGHSSGPSFLDEPANVSVGRKPFSPVASRVSDDGVKEVVGALPAAD